MKIWEKTKELGVREVIRSSCVGCIHKGKTNTHEQGYKHPKTNSVFVDGVGYSDNEEVKVFSGEWTLGAVNMLRNMAPHYPEIRNELGTLLAIVHF